MDRPSESFAKSVTRKRFQEIFNGSPKDKNTSFSARSAPEGVRNGAIPQIRARSAGNVHESHGFSLAEADSVLLHPATTLNADLPIPDDCLPARGTVDSSVTWVCLAPGFRCRSPTLAIKITQ